MVVNVERHVLIILSDTTKGHIRMFADYVVESSEVTTGITSYVSPIRDTGSAIRVERLANGFGPIYYILVSVSRGGDEARRRCGEGSAPGWVMSCCPWIARQRRRTDCNSK